jgi:hypothetical protein
MRRQRHNSLSALRGSPPATKRRRTGIPNAPDNGTAAGLRMLLAAAVPSTGRL